MANDVVIAVDNVSKLYRLGQFGTGTVSRDLQRWWALKRGKEDPFMKVGQANDRTSKEGGEFAWALKDINFNIKNGDTIGIIGKNGAGKSTLLKLLSRITLPSTGEIKIRGRIASLLEVGTGFHPELTGKENIFMNGAILGMTRKEITSKFDEIVDFAGVALYIDTPVKRYSSGMYVRLAFAVAAHLEPEILIVDEVLAVGDGEFQKKCLGKMDDVAKHGRTVIFVSHNMQAVQNLCKKTIYLNSGRLVEYGETIPVINNYLKKEVKSNFIKTWPKEDAPSNEFAQLFHAEIIRRDGGVTELMTVHSSFDINFKFALKQSMFFNLGVFLYSANNNVVFFVRTEGKETAAGEYEATLNIPGDFLNNGLFYINLIFIQNSRKHIMIFEDLLSFEIAEYSREGFWYGPWEGAVRPTFLNFKIKE